MTMLLSLNRICASLCMFVTLCISFSSLQGQTCNPDIDGTIWVTTPADEGAGSLREAILCANATSGANTIKFNIPGAATTQTIFVAATSGAELPAITDANTVIDATTQPGFGSNGNFAPRIILDGIQHDWTGAINALYFLNAANCEVYGLEIRNFPDDGIDFYNSPNARIGAPGKGNVIFNVGWAQDYFPDNPNTGPWNGCAIVMRTSSSGAIIQGNYIGTNYDETNTDGNESTGILCRSSANNIRIGGELPGEANVIANQPKGIRVDNCTGINIQENSFYCNTTTAIELVNSANNNLTAPEISIATNNAVSGNAAGATAVIVYIQENSTCGGTPCQGKTFLGKADVINGAWTLPSPYSNGIVLTGTEILAATSYDGAGNASPFSICKSVTVSTSCTEVNGDIWVTNTNDDGDGSLRSAINCANDSPGPNTIKFNIPGAGPHIIYVGTSGVLPLPTVLDAYTVIDGTSQPGFGTGGSSEPFIILDGSLPPWNNPINALLIRGDYCDVYGLEVRNFPDDGIDVTDANFCKVGAPNKGNVIYNCGWDQDFFDGAPNSGPWNGCGIVLKSGAANCTVQGNIVGRNYTGSQSPGNEYCGLVIQHGGDNNTIGGDGPGEGNIFAHGEIGIRISDGSYNCQIQENSIYCNSVKGILLQGSANGSHPEPVIQAAVATSITGTGNNSDLIEVFIHDDFGCVNAPCQGKTYLGSAICVNGSWTLSAPFADGVTLAGGENIVATATNPVGNTSEFSACALAYSDCTLITDVTNITAASCTAPGAAWVSVSGGDGSYIFNYGEGISTSNSISNLEAGNYALTITDESGCFAVENFTIPGADLPALILENIYGADCGQSSGSIHVSGMNGTPPYTFDIGNGPTSNTVFDNLSSGSYQITLTDAAQCSVSLSASIGGSVAPTININNIVDADCGETNGAFSVSAGGTSPPFTFDIGNGPTGTSLFSNLAAGNYQLTVTSINGCSAVRNVTVGAVGGFNIGKLVTQTSCGLDNGAISVLTNSGGIPPFTYNIGNGPSTNSYFTDLAPGLYTITVLDAVGCTGTAFATIYGSTAPFSTVSTSDAGCGTNDGAINISVVGGAPPYTYNIGTGNSSESVFSDVAPGAYTVSTTDGNGCNHTVDVTVGGGSNPALASAAENAICGLDNGAIAVLASGGQEPYTYDIGQGPTSSTLFENLAPGTYTIVASDAAGCTTSVQETVGFSDAPSMSLFIVEETCGSGNGSIVTNVVGGLPPFTFDLGEGPQTEDIFYNLGAGTYFVTLTDANDCTAVSQGFLANSFGPELTVNTTDASCGEGNGSINATVQFGSGPYSFNIGNGEQGNGNFFDLAAGAYTVVVSDVNGCTDSQAVTLAGTTNPSVTGTTTDASCGQQNGSLSLSASGGTSPYNYNIGNGNTANPAFSDLSAGIYVATITDVNNCTATESFTIVGTGGGPTVSATATDVDCGLPNGSITIEATGGAGEYSYDVGTGVSTDNIITDLAAGTYDVSVTDANGCIGNTTVTVGETGNTLPQSNFSVASNYLNIAITNNTLDADAYLWDFGDGTSSTEPAPSHDFAAGGTYTVCLTATNSCGDSNSCQEINITPPPSDPVTFYFDEASGPTGATVQIPVSVENFSDIIGFSFSIHIDTTVASFTGITGFNLPGMSEGNFNSTPSTLSTIWIDNEVTGVSVPDFTQIFVLEIFLRDQMTDCATLTVNDIPTSIEIIQNQDGLDVVAPYNFVTNPICIVQPTATVNINGVIANENGEVMPDVTVDCNAYQELTSLEGAYAFNEMLAGEDYLIDPTYDDILTNGVTTFDIVKIRQHILNISMLDSPYKIIAADANNSGSVTTFDLVTITNAILGRIDVFPDNESWRFVPADYVFPDPTNPFDPPFPETISETNLTEDAYGLDFIAIKIGDVTVDAQLSGFAPPADETLDLWISEQQATAGAELLVPVYADNFQDIVGFQFDLVFDEQQLAFKEILPAGLSGISEANIGRKFLSKGYAPISWVFPGTGTEGRSARAGEELFFLKFEALKDIATLEGLLDIGQRRLKQEAYDSSFEHFGVQMSFRSKDLAQQMHINVETAVYPNPFAENCFVTIATERNINVEIEVINMLGQQIYTQYKACPKGKTLLQLDDNVFPEKGLYFCTIKYQGNQITHKITRVGA